MQGGGWNNQAKGPGQNQPMKPNNQGPQQGKNQQQGGFDFNRIS